MTVEELIKELESMPQNLPVYIEGEVANKVTLENYQGQGNMYDGALWMTKQTFHELKNALAERGEKN